MRKVRLETSDGRAVTEGLIPPFLAPPGAVRGEPDVIFWGERVFTFALNSEAHAVYREAFAVALVMDTEGTPGTPAPILL
jgi:hypothetical protein